MTYLKNGIYNISDIQANILKAHGKKYACFCFISFNENLKQSQIRQWLSSYAEQCVTSTLTQFEDPDVVTNLSITNLAYQILGIAKHVPDDCSFILGLDHLDVKSRLSIQNSYRHWDKCYSNYEGINNPTHALVMIASNCYELIEQKVGCLATSLDKIATIKFIESGNRLPRNKGHFGYVDGISQPKLLKKIKDVIHFGEHIPLILKEEKKNNGDSYWPNKRFGSYLVFHKYKLEPYTFETKVWNLHKKLEEFCKKVYPEAPLPTLEFVYAQIVGRFRDGTPLSKYDRPNNKVDNDFDYSNDRSGLKCPFHAHIRKNNPRVDRDGEEVLIARRGMPYGTIEDRKNGKEVGLLFMSFQRSIVDQFEKIFLWSLDSNFSKKATGFDPINSLSMKKKDIDMRIGTQTWNVLYDQVGKDSINFFNLEPELEEIIELKGAMYFYTPSISFLIDLADEEGTSADFGDKKTKCRESSYIQPNPGDSTEEKLIATRSY